MPETVAAAQTINAWIGEQDELVPGTPLERGLGYARFDLRGMTISSLAQPYRFFRLKRAQDEYEAMGPEDRKALDAILASCNAAPLLEAKLTREIGRKDNREVWL